MLRAPTLPPGRELQLTCYIKGNARATPGDSLETTLRRTEQTLLEQMKISDPEIARRKALLSLSDDELALLASHKPLIEAQIGDIVDEFYAHQTEIDDIALLIGDADTLNRLRAAQRKYVLDLFAGDYGSDYVNNRLRIGMVHKRIGVPPKLYLSAVMTLKDILGRTLASDLSDPDQLPATLTALDKLLNFDTTLVIDTYIGSLIGEIEVAKQRVEDYATDLEQQVAARTRELELQAKLDPLTSLYNQRAAQEMLGHDLASARRRHTLLSLVYFDVDEFKQINDQHGHIAGDEVLQAIGTAMRESIRETDTPCRLGGDEFVLILPECSSTDAQTVCQKIIAQFSARFPDYSLSMGIATTGPKDHADGIDLIREADQKMYRAKQHAGFQVCT